MRTNTIHENDANKMRLAYYMDRRGRVYGSSGIDTLSLNNKKSSMTSLYNTQQATTNSTHPKGQ